MSYEDRIEALLDDMSVFEDWTEKYEFIISLGRKLPALDTLSKLCSVLDLDANEILCVEREKEY